MTDAPRVAPPRWSRSWRRAATEPGTRQWINPVLALAALALGISVDVHSLVPLRTSGRVIFLLACALLALALATQVNRSIRRMTGLFAAMTALLMVALWAGYQEENAFDPERDAGMAGEDVSDLLRERNDDVRTHSARGGVRIVTPTDLGQPDRQLFAGTAAPLRPPMDAGELRLDPVRGQLVGVRVTILVPNRRTAEVRIPCASFNRALFQSRVPLSTLHLGTVVCLRTANQVGHLIVTNRPWSTRSDPWLEFQVVT
jgi:hypothetical protein